MSQVPVSLSTKHAAHSAHASSHDMRGSDSPWAHRSPSEAPIHAHQVPWLLLYQIYSMWPDVTSPRRSGITRECTP